MLNKMKTFLHTGVCPVRDILSRLGSKWSVLVLETLHENGIRTWVHVSPIFPYLSDWKALLEAAAGFTDSFSFENLKLRSAALPRVLLYITRRHPQLRAAYERIFRQNDMTYWRALRKEILAFCNERKIAAAVHFSEKMPHTP